LAWWIIRHILSPNIIYIGTSVFDIDSYPIEVGVVLSTGQKYYTLIKPADDWLYWDQKAELAHGLGLELLWSHGKPISTVTRELNTFLENKPVYSDGWVVDKPWL
jgi:hypothetical protein